MIRGMIIALALMLPAASAYAAKEKPLVDPDGAYVLVEISHLKDGFLKGTSVPGSLTIARYDREKGDVRGGDRSPETALANEGAPRLQISSKPLGKSKQSRLYLIRLEPDTWVIEGSGNTAFSLGSRTFDVKPGQVIDLGHFTPMVDWVDGEGPKGMAAGIMGAALFGSFKPKDLRPIHMAWRPRQQGDIALPAELAHVSLAVATYTDGATFGNYLGGLVNRIGGRASRATASAAEVKTVAELAQ